MTYDNESTASRRAFLPATATGATTLAGCNSSVSDDRTKTGTSSPSSTSVSTTTKEPTPADLIATYDAIRERLGEAFAELDTVNPWRVKDATYSMSPTQYVEFDAEKTRTLANDTLSNLQEVKADIPDGSEEETTYAQVAGAAVLAEAAARQFAIVGEASMLYFHWYGMFQDDSYDPTYTQVDDATQIVQEVWEPAKDVRDAIESLLAVGAPDVPNFSWEPWPEEQPKMEVI